MKMFVSIIICFVIIGCSGNKKDEVNNMLEKKIKQFAEVKVKYDETLLNEREKMVVKNLYEAAKLIDELFLEQAYSKNHELKNKLATSANTEDKTVLKYFNIMFGPFDRLDGSKPFYGTDTKPLGANFYPADMKKDEFENWIKNNPGDEKSFTSEFTIIKRDGAKLATVPYSEYYKEKLTKIAGLLNQAAEYSDNASLKKYLITRAKAFLSNDYYESDMAWMDVKDSKIEVVIGPYEVYEDALFNYKASFECFLTLVDPVESQKLKTFAKYLKDIENNLPIPQEYKNFTRGSESPIAVVQEIFNAGDCKAGVQTLAFNLPNDERVRKAKGSKKVMLKNIHEAKFEKILKPIAELVLDSEQLKYVTFDGFFNHTLMHEISHGVGPAFVKTGGKEIEVKKTLKETSSSIEECKADILGMFNNIFMINKKVYPQSFDKETWVTFLAGVFRTVRFGIGEAHSDGTAIIYNYLLEKGAYEFNEAKGTVKVNFDKIYKAVTDLANIILMIEAKGDYEGAKKILADYAKETPSMKVLREKLTSLPVDIKPVFHIETGK